MDPSVDAFLKLVFAAATLVLATFSIVRILDLLLDPEPSLKCMAGGVGAAVTLFGIGAYLVRGTPLGWPETVAIITGSTLMLVPFLLNYVESSRDGRGIPRRNAPPRPRRDP